MTDDLIQAYQLLEAQVAELNVKLQLANDELVAKSAANEQLAARLVHAVAGHACRGSRAG